MARRQVGEPHFHLAARPLLPQHDGAALVLTNDVERILADIDADYTGGCVVVLAGHGMLPVFVAQCQLRSLAGREHGRTIPLAALRHRQLTHCERSIRH
jgi:hypothetical protein